MAPAEAVDKNIHGLLAQKNTLAEQVQAGRAQLTELSQQREEMSAELSFRLEREDKFKTAKTKLNPSEGEILFNAPNDIVLRLGGLSFDIGKSETKDAHVPHHNAVIPVGPGSARCSVGLVDGAEAAYGLGVHIRIAKRAGRAPAGRLGSVETCDLCWGLIPDGRKPPPAQAVGADVRHEVFTSSGNAAITRLVVLESVLKPVSKFQEQGLKTLGQQYKSYSDVRIPFA